MSESFTTRTKSVGSSDCERLRAKAKMPLVIFAARLAAVRILSSALSRVSVSLCRMPILA